MPTNIARGQRNVVNKPGELRVSEKLPLWEVFIRSKRGLEHKHVGSLHAADAEQAIQFARDVYTRRMEGCSILGSGSNSIHATQEGESEELLIRPRIKFIDIPPSMIFPTSLNCEHR